MNARKQHVRGSLVALVTPFADDEVDFEALDGLVDFQLAADIDGLVLCGTTAEAPTLSELEQARIIDHVVQRVSGRCPVIVGSGTNCTRKSLMLSRQAQTLGAHGVMLVAPYYNKPTQEGLRRHFGTVVEGLDLPVILYNIPGRCGVAIEIPTLCRLYDEHPNIVAVKHATGTIEDAARLRQACAIDILSGDDPLTLPLLEIGAHGVVSVLANLIPKRVKALVDAHFSDRRARAATLHAELLELGKALLSMSTNPIPIKTALAMRGMIREEFRLPMCPMDAGPRQQLTRLLQRHGLVLGSGRADHVAHVSEVEART